MDGHSGVLTREDGVRDGRKEKYSISEQGDLKESRKSIQRL